MRPRQDIESTATSACKSEQRESNWVSWLIPVIVVANIVVFVVEMYFNNCPDHMIKNKGSSNGYGSKCMARFLRRFSFQPLMENPLFGPSSSTLEKLGALNWSKVIHQNQGWRLISCIWLHAGIIHLLANVLSLIVIGIRLEQQFGFVRIGVIYLLSGLGGSILSSLFIHNRTPVGASGPLFGLLGAMLSELITNWSIYTRKIAALVMLLVVVVINIGVGILPHVENFVNVGGFLTGFLLGFILMARPQFGWIERHNVSLAVVRVKSKYKAYQSVLRAASLIILTAGFTLGVVMLFRGVDGYEHCHWCRYASCVWMSKWKCN